VVVPDRSIVTDVPLASWIVIDEPSIGLDGAGHAAGDAAEAARPAGAELAC
jgi:hypothetical protein